MLSNLAGNAVKSTEEGAVTISVRDGGGGMLEFSVADTWCGIEPDSMDSVFSRFSGTENSIGAKEGTGLGLSTAKAVVEAHGCRVWVESTPGEGSCFRFTAACATAAR